MLQKYISSLLYAPLLVCFLLCSTSFSFGQTQKISILSDSVASIGDQIELKISLHSPKKEIFLFPNLSDTLDQRIEIFPAKFKLDTLYNDKTKEYIYQKTFVFAMYEEGIYQIPSMCFLLKGKPSDTTALEFTIPALKYTIVAPAVDTNLAIKDIKPIFSIPYTFREILPWILIPLLVVGLILLLIFYLRRRKQHQPLFTHAVKPPVPANILAIEQLNTLHNKKLWQQNLIKEYYTELTDIIRVYIDNDIHIPTLEKTTDEILTEFGQHYGKGTAYSLLESILLP
ncbi:MAG: hypothetical protein RR328_03490, partial [Bacteroidales bacterium]